MRKFYTSRPGGPREKESFPLGIWQHHLCGRAASGTRQTQPTGPTLSGLGFLDVVIQCLSSPLRWSLWLLMFTVQNCYHILSKVVVKGGTRSVRFTEPQAYKSRKYLDLKQQQQQLILYTIVLLCIVLMEKENESQKDLVTWLGFRHSRQPSGWSSSNYFTPMSKETHPPDPELWNSLPRWSKACFGGLGGPLCWFKIVHHAGSWSILGTWGNPLEKHEKRGKSWDSWFCTTIVQHRTPRKPSCQNMNLVRYAGDYLAVCWLDLLL